MLFQFDKKVTSYLLLHIKGTREKQKKFRIPCQNALKPDDTCKKGVTSFAISQHNQTWCKKAGTEPYLEANSSFKTNKLRCWWSQVKDGCSRIQPPWQMLLHRIFSQRQWHYRNCRCGVTISKLNVDMVVVLHKYCTDLWFTFQGKLSQVTTLITYGVMLPHLDQQCTQLMISFKCCLHAYKNIAPFSEKGGFLVTLSKKNWYKVY